DAQMSQDFQLQQLQDKVSVTAGGMLTLTCTTSGVGPPGPMKWLKGWDSGNETIYDQNSPPPPRVTRVVPGSNADFSIHIGNVHPEDAGTYYCVKFRKVLGRGDEVFRQGKGTEVSLHESALVPSIVAAAVVLCFLLSLLVAFYMYRRKHRGQTESQCLARTAATGSLSPIRLQCCAGTPSTPSKVLDAETSHLPSQQSSKEDHEIHYADLQPLPTALRRGRSPGTACSEYASVRVAAK
ncbi:SHPS1 phosphatase, partial [Hemiprocne comata]|nr:SHPS1 phosphatase [Hemiprocne comata]